MNYEYSSPISDLNNKIFNRLDLFTVIKWVTVQLKQLIFFSVYFWIGCGKGSRRNIQKFVNHKFHTNNYLHSSPPHTQTKTHMHRKSHPLVIYIFIKFMVTWGKCIPIACLGDRSYKSLQEPFWSLISCLQIVLLLLLLI